MFNAFEELFAPGRKHTRDEQNRLELTRVDVGDNDPVRGPIDLASGKVVVRMPERSSKADDTEAEDRTGDESGDGAEQERKPDGSE
ncbi:DUF6191 domain-containing protein [Streptomyces muensis]|uniref:DUF6191 domain-containing protein n=1 Tax=Streptomyces muensis TaxID=1077944 RepID=A0A9X1TME2_STRM4|nr:DUF6191 domain-containing protein [Streptomyces muensis]MCF1595629.1 DUF6191 domain-containing protein [Streptomyces muensis]